MTFGLDQHLTFSLEQQINIGGSQNYIFDVLFKSYDMPIPLDSSLLVTMPWGIMIKLYAAGDTSELHLNRALFCIAEKSSFTSDIQLRFISKDSSKHVNLRYTVPVNLHSAIFV